MLKKCLTVVHVCCPPLRSVPSHGRATLVGGEGGVNAVQAVGLKGNEFMTVINYNTLCTTEFAALNGTSTVLKLKEVVKHKNGYTYCHKLPFKVA